MTTDEELQQNIERGNSDRSIDAQAYQKVFSALEKEPEVSLSPLFADNVISMLQQSSKIRLSAWELALLIVVMVFSVIALLVAVVITGFTLDLGFLKAVSGYKGLFMFAVFLFVLFQWFDRRLMQKRFTP